MTNLYLIGEKRSSRDRVNNCQGSALARGVLVMASDHAQAGYRFAQAAGRQLSETDDMIRVRRFGLSRALFPPTSLTSHCGRPGSRHGGCELLCEPRVRTSPVRTPEYVPAVRTGPRTTTGLAHCACVTIVRGALREPGPALPAEANHFVDTKVDTGRSSQRQRLVKT